MDSLNTSVPSFYEIVMQDRLQELIFQAISFFSGVLSEKLNFLVPLRYLNQEMASLACACIDGYYMYYTKATFSENFYSICRDFSGIKGIISYLFVHYALPLIVKGPIISKMNDLAKGLTMAGFLYLKFDYFSPEYFILRQKLVRQEKKVQMGYWFLAFLAGLKLLQIFYSAPKRTTALVSVKNIKAPYNDSAIPASVCGICKDKWVNPTALTSSGYIFCYTCIRNHLGVFSACPVTNTRSSLRNLRKLHTQ